MIMCRFCSSQIDMLGLCSFEHFHRQLYLYLSISPPLSLYIYIYIYIKLTSGPWVHGPSVYRCTLVHQRQRIIGAIHFLQFLVVTRRSYGSAGLNLLSSICWTRSAERNPPHPICSTTIISLQNCSSLKIYLEPKWLRCKPTGTVLAEGSAARHWSHNTEGVQKSSEELDSNRFESRLLGQGGLDLPDSIFSN